VWHHSQTLEELADGGVLLKMRVGGIREIKTWVMGWGAEVEVLAPPELRANVAEDSRRMSAQYTDV
jgi:predicted DNA-binding transcriptional regulator YafY